MNTSRYAVACAVVAIVLAATGCGSPQSAESRQDAGSIATSAPSPPPVGAQFDPQWLAVTPGPGWEELGRTINADYQQFNFRPEGETELPRGCNGCAPFTAELTAYAPDKFDAAQARTGQPVSVVGDNDGVYRPATETDFAMLSWQYAPNAWATVRGKTSTTAGLEKMRELATALNPTERMPIKLPLSFRTLPVDMPLASIDSDELGYGTRIRFAACEPPEEEDKCTIVADVLNVQIWPKSDYFGIVDEPGSVPVDLGGKEGIYNEQDHEVGVKIAPELLVKFWLDRPGAAAPASNLRGLLAGVTWAPNPADAATWPAVADWVK